MEMRSRVMPPMLPGAAPDATAAAGEKCPTGCAAFSGLGRAAGLAPAVGTAGTSPAARPPRHTPIKNALTGTRPGGGVEHLPDLLRQGLGRERLRQEVDR